MQNYTNGSREKLRTNGLTDREYFIEPSLRGSKKYLEALAIESLGKLQIIHKIMTNHKKAKFKHNQ